MLTITLAGQPFELDTDQEYLDYYLVKGEPRLVAIDATDLVNRLATGETGPLLDELVVLDRWVGEAPRKRHFRGLIKEGFSVLSGEQWFLGDDGPKIIDGLERTGHLARRLLERVAPAQAARCKQHPHPASKHYIDP